MIILPYILNKSLLNFRSFVSALKITSKRGVKLKIENHQQQLPQPLLSSQRGLFWRNYQMCQRSPLASLSIVMACELLHKSESKIILLVSSYLLTHVIDLSPQTSLLNQNCGWRGIHNYHYDILQITISHPC